MEYGELAARNSMDEYTDEEITIIDDFRADSCSIMELLSSLIQIYHSAPYQLDIETSLFSNV